MNESGLKPQNASIDQIGITNAESVHWNLPPTRLVEETIERKQGYLVDTGALAVDTGEFTGRSPKDKFVVYDETTKDTVWWGDVNNRIEKDTFDKLHKKLLSYFSGKEVWIR